MVPTVHNPWLASMPWGEPHLIGGTHQSGVGHMVVGREGQLIWDPNPARRGIASAGEVVFLLPELGRRWLDPELWSWPAVSYDLTELLKEVDDGR